MARARRLAVWTLGALAGVLLLIAALVLFVDRTERGQTLALGFVLKRIEGAVDGTITVERVRSPRLLGGATLYGIAVRGPEGRPFLEVDSARATYDWRTFLTGDVVLSSLVAWGPRLTISRYPGEEDFNADRLFRSEGPTPEVDPTRRVVFERVRLVDAYVEILQPVDPEDPPPPRAMTVTLPGVEGPLHRIFFEGIQAWIPEAVVASPDQVGPQVTLDSLSMVGYVYEDPFRLTQLRGTVSWAEGKLVVVADELALPGTLAAGRIVADFTPEGRGGRERGWAVDVELTAERYTLGDLAWLLPELPEGTGAGRVDVRATDLGELRLGFSDATLVMEESRVSGEGALLWSGDGGGPRLEGVRLRTDRFALSRLEPFLGELPLVGTVEGRLALDGTAERVRAEGVLTLREPGHAPTTADFSGTFELGAGPGVTGLVAELSEVDFGLLSVFLPDSRFQGSGRGTVRATGSLDRGLTFRTDFVHEPGGGLPRSQVAAEGSVRRVGDDLSVDVRADVAPLSLTALRSYYPDLPFSGEVTGAVHASGALSDLTLTTDLETPAGRLAVETRFDARDPGAFYRVEGELVEFALSSLVADLPEPTVFTGSVLLEGRGTDLATATIDARLDARTSRVGELDVERAWLEARVRGGVLHLDSLDARVSGVDLRASGTLAASEGVPAGVIQVVFEAESLEGLAPLLGRERDVLVQDELTALEREVLRAQGVDPDTLPTREEVAVSGRVRGDVTLAGSLQRFSADGFAVLEDVRYGTTYFRGAQLTFAAEGLPELGETLRARVVADSVELLDRAFRAVTAEVVYARPAGVVDVVLERDDTEDYRGRARVQLDSLGGRLDLESLALRFDTVTWTLEQPGVVTWDEHSVGLSNVVLAQPGPEGMRLAASGVLPREGEADFQLDVRGLRLEHLSHLLQRDDLEVAGLVDLNLGVRGTAEQPLVQGTVEAAGVRFQGYSLGRVEGDLEYRDRRIALDLEAWENELRVLQATGIIPAVLDLRGPRLGFPDEEIDLRVLADSLPAAFAASLVPALLDVEGTVAGAFDIGGTLDNPAPSGELTLQNAAWTVEALGVRHRSVQGTLTLRRDGTTEVDLLAQADGFARVTGSVRLTPLSNPTLNLDATFTNFLAVDRRDAVANVSGIVTLRGTYHRPVIEGLAARGQGLRVDRGALYLEEFVRAATVVDLTDPRFAGFVDLSILEPRLVQEVTNPFMQNLIVNVDLVVEQDTWLRSSEMEVEMAGPNLAVQYDRSRAEVVLVGVLQAVRGSYTVLGRRFQVQQGWVEFVGIPGIDPDLDIVARTRVRRQNSEPLDIVARVTGTLTQPRVELVSDEAAMSQSDLVSHLLFGRPSYELASGERALLQGAAGSFVGAGLGAVGSVFSGAVATRLGAVLAQQWGLDYFAITELGSVGWQLGSVTQTQVELGQYLSQDLFLVLAFQPVQVVGANPLTTFGIRLEYTPTDAYTLEGFWEDRFLRSRAVGFHDPALQRQKILGLSVFTEWGY